MAVHRRSKVHVRGHTWAPRRFSFLRPPCYYNFNFPESVLPLELRDGNPRGILRTVNGVLTRDGVA